MSIDYTIDLDAAVEVDRGNYDGRRKAGHAAEQGIVPVRHQIREDSISDVMEFVYADVSMNLQTKSKKDHQPGDNSSSSALTALGYNPQNADGTDKTVSDGISLSEFNENQKQLNDTV